MCCADSLDSCGTQHTNAWSPAHAHGRASWWNLWEGSLAAVSTILVVRLALVAVGGMITRLVIVNEVVVAIALPAAVHSFVGNTPKLVMIAQLKLVAVITTSCLEDLVLALLLKQAVVRLRVINTFEVLRRLVS